MTPSRAYYNENDPFAAEWLRGLVAAGRITPGRIDDRSIHDVRPDDLRGVVRAHFFGGIAGWDLALQLAGWPADREVWTGSCPCQPYSVAGRRRGDDDPRNLWPVWRGLIAECTPSVVLGEQTAGKAGRVWLAAVRADLEELGYAVGAADLCASGIGAPHIRQRLFFGAVRLGHPESSPRVREPHKVRSGEVENRGPSTADGLGDPGRPGLARRQGQRGDDEPQQSAAQRAGGHAGWSSPDWLPCADGKTRPAQPGVAPLVAGLPAGMVRLDAAQRRLASLAGLDGASLKRARAARVGALRGYGNAIVPQLAAEFIGAFMGAKASYTPPPRPPPPPHT